MAACYVSYVEDDISAHVYWLCFRCHPVAAQSEIDVESVIGRGISLRLH